VPQRAAATDGVVPKESVIIIEDIPMNPMLSAVASPAVGTIEASDFQIELMECLNITGKDDFADALKIFLLDAVGKLTRKAVTDNLAGILYPIELYESCFMIALGADKAVLSNRR
jgi:hypothetical protein